MRVSRICKQCGFSSLLDDYNTCPICNNMLIDPGFILGHKLIKLNPFKEKIIEWIENQNGYKIPEELSYKRELFYNKKFQTIEQEREQRLSNASKESFKEFQKQQKNAPKCPTCGSTNISNISTISRAVSVGTVGLASGKIGKTRKCNSCGYMW